LITGIGTRSLWYGPRIRKVALALLLVPLAARATVLEAWDTSRLVRESPAIVQAVVAEQQVVSPDGKVIYTDTRLTVSRYLVGTGPSTLWVRQMGGRIGDRWMFVTGNAPLKTGQELVLFLAGSGDRRYVAGMAQGAYRVVRDAAGVRAERGFPARALPLADLVTEIRAAARERR
jgi:hypothetical protein